LRSLQALEILVISNQLYISKHIPLVKWQIIPNKKAKIPLLAGPRD